MNVAMGDGHECMRFSELVQWGTVMNVCDSLSWEVGLHSSTAVRGGRSRAPRVRRGAPIRMIRKRRYAALAGC